MAEIRLVELTKRYDSEEVLRGINLEIRDGEFMVFVGPSGCAKSTTLRLITGLEKPTSGEVWTGGKMVNGLPPKARNLAMVFQSYALFPNMTVRKNLSFGMEVRRERPDQIKAEVDRIAELLGLTALLDRKPRALSGGQAQRVALGRAIIRRPGAYLFDEPLSNLDAELRIQMRSEISSLQRQLGVTTVYVTHDQTEAMTMGDRIAVMREGRIMQVGPPLSMYSDPDNLFVAGFLGSPKINQFEIGADGGWLADEIRGKVPGATETDGITVGLRSELVRIGPSNQGGQIEFSAVVARQERLGHETLLWLDASFGSNGAAPSALAVRTSGNTEPGQSVVASFSPEDVLLFNTRSGERIDQNRRRSST